MFISTQQLVLQYGINEDIARYFVDREPPADNLYWHGKLMYLRPAVGYLFIPLIVDLLHKIGLQKEELLGNEFIHTMEQTGHISALEETKQINAAEAIAQCAALVKSNAKDNIWLIDVIEYFESKPNYITSLMSPFKALHRGDYFLFSLCALHFPKEKKEQIVQQWFALITTLLLMDDAEDAEEDMKTGEENALLEYDFTLQNIEQAKQLAVTNLAVIASLNGVMASELHRQLDIMIERSKILVTKTT